MKTIFKSALVACIALTTMLVSCATEKTNDDGNGDKTVRLQLSAEMTRAAGQHATGTVAFNDAAIYFVAGDAISRMYEIVETGGTYPTNPEGTTINEADLESGVTFINLPGNINTVYVFGNKPGGEYPASGSIAALFNAATTIAIASQTDDEGGFDNVSLYGKSTLTQAANPDPDSENSYYTAHVEIKPVVARLEIGQIAATYDAEDFTSTIEGFTLEGIYVDNYYTSIGFDGTVGTLVPQGDTETVYPRTGNPTVVYDEDNFVTDDEITYISDSEGAAPVWSYNLLAGIAPTIVIKVSDVTIAADEEDKEPMYPGTQYLTINRIIDNETGELATFESGKVYRIVNLDFAEGHLTDKPNVRNIDIRVTIEVLPWDEVDASHEF